MPFKSKKQQRWAFAAEDRGELPKGTAKRWAHHTKSIKSLPEKASKKAGLEKDAVTPMQWIGLQVTPLLRYLAEKGGQGMSYLGSKMPKTVTPKLNVLERGGAGLDTRSNWLDYIKHKGLEGSESALESLGRIGGWTTAAAAIPAGLGVAAGIGAHRRKKEEAKIQDLVNKLSTGEIKAASSQDAFEEGFLASCAGMRLTSKQVADLLEKGASRKDGLGGNCRQLIDKLVNTL